MCLEPEGVLLPLLSLKGNLLFKESFEKDKIILVSTYKWTPVQDSI